MKNEITTTLRALCADFACSAISPRRQKLRALAGLRPGRPLTLDYFHDARLQACPSLYHLSLICA